MTRFVQPDPREDARRAFEQVPAYLATLPTLDERLSYLKRQVRICLANHHAYGHPTNYEPPLQHYHSRLSSHTLEELFTSELRKVERIKYEGICQQVDELAGSLEKLRAIRERIYAHEAEIGPQIAREERGRQGTLLELLNRKRKHLEQLVALEDETNKIEEPIERNMEHTTARQVLSMFYLLQAIGVNARGKRAATGRFIQFLTGKSYDNINKALKQPWKDSQLHRDADFNYVEKLFQDLKLNTVIDLMKRDKELDEN